MAALAHFHKRQRIHIHGMYHIHVHGHHIIIGLIA